MFERVLVFASSNQYQLSVFSLILTDANSFNRTLVNENESRSLEVKIIRW